MTPCEKLQLACDLAFRLPRLNAAWNDRDRGRVPDLALLREAVDWALTLHQRLPEAPAATFRALRRLALYQATARLYRMPTVLRRFRDKLGGRTPLPDEVPAWMVRDISLPVFGRDRTSAGESQKRKAEIRNLKSANC